jgi:hypothetical protein
MARTLARLENTLQEHVSRTRVKKTLRALGNTRSGKKIHRGYRPRGVGKQRGRRGLLVMMMVMMVVMAGPGSERGTCEHHRKQRYCK